MIYYDYLKNKYHLDTNKRYLKNQVTPFMLTQVVYDYNNTTNNIFLVLPSLFEAQKCYDMLSNMIDEKNILFFPQDELVAQELLDVSGDFKFERINTIISLIKNESRYIVVTHIHGAIRKEMNKDIWKDKIFTIKKDDTIDPDSLYNKLESMGYTNKYTVTRTGEYSHRGTIIDIFPLNHTEPVRLDLFGDDIDTLKTFDIETQKSIDSIDSVDILPVSEIIYDNTSDVEKVLKDFIKSNKMSDEETKKYESDINRLLLRQNISNMTRYISLIDENACTIFDFCDTKKIYFIDINKAKLNYDHMINELNDYCQTIGGYSLFNLNYFKDIDYVSKISDVISEGVLDSLDSGFDYQVSNIENFKSQPQAIVEYLQANKKKYTIIILVKNSLRLDSFKDTLIDSGVSFKGVSKWEEIEENNINLVYNEFYPSFKSEYLKLIVLNEETLFEVKYDFKKPKYKSVYKNTTKVSKYDELEIGDYVVHYTFGIGKYLGLETLPSGSVKRDYIKLCYQNDDMLYIPLEQISEIEKFGSQDIDNVKLSHLGTKEWQRTKEKVKKRIHDISDKLIALYAKREASVGYAFLPDNDMQYQFENDFGYELTPDQEKAIIEIKKDMESARVMDRLVCGDVGYGKTEVALRAAFKAVMSGKQAAILAPTTILSRQHFYTFKDRMEKYGVKVELLNRLQSAKKVREVLEGLKNGYIDVVIGTHKLLGKEVKFKDLGLLIIDEEQRFGVLQKEKIKELKVNVDSITLSATPIPRTLQMSIVGIKELSMLETPPKNRYPIQTYVLERNDAVIKDAIERELARGGQVFYMYNFTEDIYNVASHIKKLVPDARICVGHGKMDKNELEDTISSFIDKKYDVIVCTTIIETGIDMPDANTLIIHDSNRLGLSQLYQLRGRVGRSDKIAYAYLMYEPHKMLTDQALKRLDTIKEFNELGSGFKIAMRDLSIRGAGDILGDSQSGFIESVGLETYLRILNEEINKKEEEVKKEEPDQSLLKVRANRTISKDYIKSESIRVDMHKRIDKIKTSEDIEKLSEELVDRFGQFDDELKLYMYEKLFNHLLEQLQITKILDSPSQMILIMSEENSQKQNGRLMFDLQTKMMPKLSLKYASHQINFIVSKSGYKDGEYLIDITKYLEELKKQNIILNAL